MKIIFYLIFTFIIHFPTFGQVKQYEDKSLSVKDYLKLGFPSIEREWMALDYEKAVQVLEIISNQNKLQLPRKYSRNSDSVFNKITKIDNLKFINEQNVQLKVSEFGRITKCFQKLQNIYEGQGSDDFVGVGFSSENIDFAIMFGFVTNNMVQVVNDVFNTKLNDMTETQKQGLEKMKNGLRSVIAGFFGTVHSEYKFYLKDDILRLSKFYIEVIPKSIKLLNNNDLIEINNRIDEIIQNHKYAEIKNDMILLKVKIK